MYRLNVCFPSSSSLLSSSSPLFLFIAAHISCINRRKWQFKMTRNELREFFWLYVLHVLSIRRILKEEMMATIDDDGWHWQFLCNLSIFVIAYSTSANCHTEYVLFAIEIGVSRSTVDESWQCTQCNWSQINVHTHMYDVCHVQNSNFQFFESKHFSVHFFDKRKTWQERRLSLWRVAK